MSSLVHHPLADAHHNRVLAIISMSSCTRFDVTVNRVLGEKTRFRGALPAVRTREHMITADTVYSM